MNKEIKRNELYFARGNESVIIPTKRNEDAGYDIYANFEQNFMIIEPNTTKIIPTNLYCAFSEDYVMVLRERGSNGVKGIAQRAGIIDSGFRNAIGVPLTNTNSKPIAIAKKDYINMFDKEQYIIYPYEKGICQALMLPVPKMQINEISLKDLQDIPSERGLGMLGSSGK